MTDTVSIPTKYQAITGKLDMARSPTYRVGEVAKFFFAKTAYWVRWKEKNGAFDIKGVRLAGARGEGEGLHSRSYNLFDIEVMTHLLYKTGAIGEKRFNLALSCVRMQAELYGMFEEPYEYNSKSYDLTIPDVVSLSGKSDTWVRSHVIELGGVKRRWDEGVMQESWRFPSKGLQEKITELQGEA